MFLLINDNKKKDAERQQRRTRNEGQTDEVLQLVLCNGIKCKIYIAYAENRENNGYDHHCKLI